MSDKKRKHETIDGGSQELDIALPISIGQDARTLLEYFRRFYNDQRSQLMADFEGHATELAQHFEALSDPDEIERREAYAYRNGQLEQAKQDVEVLREVLDVAAVAVGGRLAPHDAPAGTATVDPLNIETLRDS